MSMRRVPPSFQKRWRVVEASHHRGMARASPGTKLRGSRPTALPAHYRVAHRVCTASPLGAFASAACSPRWRAFAPSSRQHRWRPFCTGKEPPAPGVASRPPGGSTAGKASPDPSSPAATGAKAAQTGAHAASSQGKPSDQGGGQKATGESGGDIVGDTSKGKSIGGAGLPTQVTEFYADMERKLMSRMHAQDKGRFRAIGLSSLLLLVWVLSVFGTEIRRYFASQTAEVARETLKVEALQVHLSASMRSAPSAWPSALGEGQARPRKSMESFRLQQVQTQELATALVQTLLNDQEVVRAGALFLREASVNPETQAALISLALFVLQHPDTLDEVIVLGKKLVRAVLDDPATVEQVTDLALRVLAEPRFRKGAGELVVALGQSEEVYAAVSALSSRVIQDPQVQATLGAVLAASTHEVLEDEEVLDHSKDFVAQVIADDAVQRSGGDALWNTVQYALRTRVMRAAGLCLLIASGVLISGKGGRGLGKGGE